MDWLEPEEIASAEVDERSAVVESGSRGRSVALATIAATAVAIVVVVGFTNQDPAEPETTAPTTTAPPPTTVPPPTSTTTSPPPVRDPFPGEASFLTGQPIGLLVFFEPSTSDTDIVSFLEMAESTPLVDQLTVESSNDDYGVRTAVTMALQDNATSTDVVDLTIRFENQPGVEVVWPLVADPEIRVWVDPSVSPSDLSDISDFIAEQPAVLSQSVLNQEDTFAEFQGLFANNEALASEVAIDDLPFAIVMTVDRYTAQADTQGLIAALEQLPGVRHVAQRSPN